MENDTNNKYAAIGKELKFLHIVVFTGLAASYLQLVHTFGKGDWYVLSAWLKAAFIEGIIGLLTRYVARANAIRMSAGWIWFGLIIATIISVLANVRYELSETLMVRASELYKQGVIDVAVIPMTWENIARYVDVVNWIEAISFSGIVPVFVLVMAFVILVAEKTQTAMAKEEEKRTKLNEYQRNYYASKKSAAAESEVAA
ncbi:MAG TPA: hypothetical protein PL173_07640 [Saprospiraceae bacterium]|nr:hypothetical protein [Saprospiraceae bacterium]